MKLMIVDDESTTMNGLKRHVNWQRCGVDDLHAEGNPYAAVEVCEAFRPDIILSDIRMTGMNGIEMCTLIRQQLPDVQLVFLSGYSDKEYLKAAISLLAVEYVEKPVNIPELEAAIIKAVERVRMLKETTGISEEETLLARFQKALGQRDLQQMRELADAVLDYLEKNPSASRARKIYYRFGCLLTSALRPEDSHHKHSETVMAALQSEVTLEGMAGWFSDTVEMLYAPAESSDYSTAVAQALQLVSEHITSENLSVQWLAERIYLTPAYLSTLFKQETGLLLSQYIVDQRMEMAKRILLNPRITIAQAARRVGYMDIKHFTKVFKKATGVTPNGFRRERTL